MKGVDRWYDKVKIFRDIVKIYYKKWRSLWMPWDKENKIKYDLACECKMLKIIEIDTIIDKSWMMASNYYSG